LRQENLKGSARWVGAMITYLKTRLECSRQMMMDKAIRRGRRRSIGMACRRGGVRDEVGNYLYLDTRIMHRAQSSSLIITMIRVVYTDDPSRKRPTPPGPLASSIHLTYTHALPYTFVSPAQTNPPPTTWPHGQPLYRSSEQIHPT
jgi:hypothetical protein